MSPKVKYVTKERPLSLIVKSKDKKTLYVIDDYKSLNIMWSPLTETYLVSFKQYRKEVLVSTKHFQICGRAFDEVYS